MTEFGATQDSSQKISDDFVLDESQVYAEKKKKVSNELPVIKKKKKRRSHEGSQ